MQAVIKGHITKYWEPVFLADVHNQKLVIATEGKKGQLSFTVDTGFNGDIALPKEELAKLNLSLWGMMPYLNEQNKLVETHTYRGIVVVRDIEIEASFIPGSFAIGTGILSSIGDKLVVDFQKNIVELQKQEQTVIRK